MSITAEQLRDEERRSRYVQFIVNFTSSVIAQGNMSRAEAEALVSAARARILDLFPGQDATYEMLYAGRFRRLLDESTRADDPIPEPRGVVIPFPGPSAD